MGSAQQKITYTLRAEYEGAGEIKKLSADLKQLQQIEVLQKAEESFRRTSGEMVDAKAKMRDLAKEMRSSGGEVFAASYEKARKEVTRLNTDLIKQKQRLAETRESMRNQGVDVGNLSGRYDQLRVAVDRQAATVAARSKLQVRSFNEIEAEIAGLKRAYETLERSGTASARELAVAQEQLQKKTARLNLEMGRTPNNVSRITQTMNGLRGVAASVVPVLTSMLGAYLGFNALANTAKIIKDADSATYGLEASLTAANREFDNIGSMSTWEDKLNELSKQLRIYSKSDLRQAAASTIDMTKRLGFSTEQMLKLIAVTADLSAGRTDLAGGIERVTAAMRGEAEASEFLGLTLNETYVKTWYEAQGATKGAWKNLTDLEKAQVRYLVLIEQATPLQGKAANSIKTLGGAMDLARKNLHDAISEHEGLVEVSKDLAQYISANADEIGDMATELLSGVVAITKWIVENRDLVATLGKAALGFWAVSKAAGAFATVFNALAVANTVSGLSAMVGWLSRVRGLLSAIQLTGGAAFSGIVGAAGVAAYDVAAIMRLIDQYHQLKQLEVEIGQQREQNASLMQKLTGKFAEITTATGVTIKSMEELDQAVEKGLIHYDNAVGAWVAGSGKISKSVTDSAATQKKVTGEALEDMKRKYKEYADEVQRLQEQSTSRIRDLYGELREMSRSGMTDISAWKDQKAQAEEYMQVAEQAAKAGDFSKALEYADQAKQLFKGLNTEVKDGDRVLISQQKALKTSMEGVREAGELGIEMLDRQQEAAAKAMDELVKDSGFANLREGMDETKRQWLENWDKMRSSSLSELDKVEQKIVKIVRDRTATVYVNVVEKRMLGGLISAARMAAGGRFRSAAAGFHFAGYGGGDQPKNLVMAEDGEVMIRKESVRAAGLRAALAWNAGNFQVVLDELLSRFRPQVLHRRLGGPIGLNLPPLPPVQMLAAGGPVSGGSTVLGHYTHDINFPGIEAPVRVMTDRENAERLFRGLDKMKRLRS